MNEFEKYGKLIVRVEEAIKKIQDESDNKKSVYLRPILKAEFDKVRKRCPALKKIIFGNGSFLFDFEEGSKYENAYPHQLPKYMNGLYHLCVSATDYSDDIE